VAQTQQRPELLCGQALLLLTGSSSSSSRQFLKWFARNNRSTALEYSQCLRQHLQQLRLR
jgi:hypothetical protein